MALITPHTMAPSFSFCSGYLVFNKRELFGHGCVLLKEGGGEGGKERGREGEREGRREEGREAEGITTQS